MPSEFQIIGNLAKRLRRRGARGVVTGIGDDAAVLRVGARDDVVVTTDTMVEGQHFRRAWFSWPDVGWRLAAVNLSDLAAMNATPRFALISLAVPETVTARVIEEIERGAARHLARYGAIVVGGNLTATDGPLVCDMTLIGTCRRGKAWKRHARRGDAIVVAGVLGAAAAGVAVLLGRARPARRDPLVRAYLAPVPLLEVAAALRGSRSIRGAIDVSDGLSSDLIHMGEASGLGCDVEAAALPVPPAVRAFCRRRKRDAVQWALDGGEDYALVLSVSPRRAADVCRRIRSTGAKASIVGRFTARAGTYRLIDADGRARAFKPGGWDHFAR